MYYTSFMFSSIATSFIIPFIGATPSDLYVIKTVDGLDPPDIDVFTGQTVGGEGYFSGRNPLNKEIVLTVGLNYVQGVTMSDLRKKFYQLLSPSPSSDMFVLSGTLANGSIVWSINCAVKKMEANPFSKDPQLVITLSTTSPYLTGSTVHVPTPSSSALFNVTDNEMSVPAGVTFQGTFTAAGTTFSVLIGAKRLQFNYVIQSGDFFTIITIPGARSVSLTRGATVINMLSYLATTSVWPVLYPGSNTVQSIGPAFTYFDLGYTRRYWGV